MIAHKTIKIIIGAAQDPHGAVDWLFEQSILAAILKNKVAGVNLCVIRTILKKNFFEIVQFSNLTNNHFEYGGHIGGHFEKKS